MIDDRSAQNGTFLRKRTDYAVWEAADVPALPDQEISVHTLHLIGVEERATKSFETNDFDELVITHRT